MNGGSVERLEVKNTQTGFRFLEGFVFTAGELYNTVSPTGVVLEFAQPRKASELPHNHSRKTAPFDGSTDEGRRTTRCSWYAGRPFSLPQPDSRRSCLAVRKAAVGWVHLFDLSVSSW